MRHKTADEIKAGMAGVIDAPSDQGVVRLVVRRPAEDEREILEEGQLDTVVGLAGDDWVNRPSMKTGVPSPYAQVTVMNARYAELIAGDDHASWAQAGDQLYVDLDISEDNMPPGTRIVIGEAVIEVQAEPHTGCAKFSARFGSDALRVANSEQGRSLRLRGANATVVRSGTVRPRDIARKL